MTQSHSLIEEYCADAKVTSGSLSRHYWTVLVLAALPIALIGLWIFHLAGASVRPDYFDLITNSGVALKQVIPLMILLTGAPIIIMLTLPDIRQMRFLVGPCDQIPIKLIAQRLGSVGFKRLPVRGWIHIIAPRLTVGILAVLGLVIFKGQFNGGQLSLDPRLNSLALDGAVNSHGDANKNPDDDHNYQQFH